MTTKEKSADEQALETLGIGKVSQSDLDKAKKEGVLEAAKEDAKASFRYATDGQLPGESGAQKWAGMHDIMMFAPVLDLSIEAFTDRLKDGADEPIPEDKAAGLLELERSGQNRTDYVKALCKRLSVDSPYEVTAAGPGYTNDVSATTVV